MAYQIDDENDDETMSDAEWRDAYERFMDDDENDTFRLATARSECLQRTTEAEIGNRRLWKCERRWPEARLQREFSYLRERYWPGQLRDHALVVARIKPETCFIGLHDSKAKQIIIDLVQHRSDSGVRSTLLHELCHAAAGHRSRGHDIYFFWEVEKLLAVGAPIRVNFVYYEHGREVDPDLLDLLPRCAEIRQRQKARRPVHPAVPSASIPNDLPF
jgi:hypothetical protein